MVDVLDNVSSFYVYILLFDISKTICINTETPLIYDWSLWNNGNIR